jgi:polar amino acid transport system substrate-binding protein
VSSALGQHVTHAASCEITPVGLFEEQPKGTMSIPTRTRNPLFLGGALLASVALLAGCTATGTAGDDSSASGSTLDDLRASGVVTVGFAGEAPYSFMEGDELTGATVALHKVIFANLGIDVVEGVSTDFGALIPGLQAGRFDVVSAGMSILPERCEQASFSEPEFNYTTALMVESGNPLGLSDMQSIVDSGAQMATMTGAVESSYADALGIDAMNVATPQDGMDAVVNGRADVFALTGISLNWMVQNAPEASVEVTDSFVASIDGVPQVGAGGTVFLKGDQELVDAYNTELLKITSDVDAYLAIVGDFGFTAGELPDPTLSTAILCAGN